MKKVFDYELNFQKTILKNGVVVVTESHPHTRAVSAGIFINEGTRDEPASLNGVAHFLEHLVFKGTKKRSALQIAKSLESVGGDLNAYTTREYTCFHATSLKENIKLNLDVLIDLVTHANCSKEEFLKEREVVLHEIDMSFDQFDEYIFDVYYEECFKGHSLARPILGTKGTVKNLSRKQVFDFYENRYIGENLVVAVTGDIQHQQIVDYCKEGLSRKSLSQKSKRKAPKIKSSFVKHVQKPSEQTHVLMGFPAVSFKSPYRFEAFILNALLGGGMTSRLYQKIREKKGWVYSVYSYLNTFTDSGLFSIYAGTNKEYLKNVISCIYSEIESLQKNGIKDRELQFFKRQLHGQLLLGADDIENRMTSLGVNEMVFKRYRPVEETLQEIEKITAPRMNQYIKEHLNFDELGLITLGDK